MDYAAREPLQFERPRSAFREFIRDDIHEPEHPPPPPSRTSGATQRPGSFSSQPTFLSTTFQSSQELQNPALSTLAALAANAQAAPTTEGRAGRISQGNARLKPSCSLEHLKL
ncbi:uncharacterized protein LTR77_000608 [Saxophila tyrrhenica]|uniref:Uncharacterized protein n=1 Tax=Saxophila tyrrhenica TaxID=1690608 RepID=A0AAV9PNH3_9PEZI|nr:hypothetical protein LTR77_000608 [Saxophila tyrrhenica]